MAKKFRDLKQEGKKAFIPFITAGDPTLKDTEHYIYLLEKLGADIIELGIPFSDPMADGPVIQASSERALKKGTNLKKVLALVKKVRRKTEIPILLMGYYNPIFKMGVSQFAERARSSGVDAVLVVDLPPEESQDLWGCLRKNRIDLVRLITPTSNTDRIQAITRQASGFLYYVSIKGITGAKLSITQEIQEQVLKIKKISKLPVCIGFGISGPRQASTLAPYCDGIVVGSALVSRISRKVSEATLSKFLNSLRKSIH